MKLKFSKMHGIGNDFMVLNGTQHNIILSSKQIQHLADRHRGVGFDQLLILEASDDRHCDFRYRIFNADGGEVEQCGNGARCAAKFIQQQQLSTKHNLRLQTMNNFITVMLQADDLVTVDMGLPKFLPVEIPFEATQAALTYSLQVEQQHYEIAVVSMGNPHAIVVVDKVATAPVLELGAKIEKHPRFPKRVNVEFMQVVARNHIKLRVFERGTGETEACGSGACAAVVAGKRLGLLDSKVIVNLPGGDLTIEWQGNNHPVLMTGPAELAYQGEIEI